MSPRTNTRHTAAHILKSNYSFFSKMWNSTLYHNAAHWIIIAIALIPLLLVQQVSRSMIESISERIIETDSAHFLFTPYEYDMLVDSEDRDAVISDITRTEGITSAFAEVRGIGIIRKGVRKTGMSIRGVPDTLLQDDKFTQYITLIDGTLEMKNVNEIIVGKAIARRLQVAVGDEVLVLTVRSEQLQSLPKISKNRVAGIVSTGYEELDRNWVFTRVERAVEILAPTEQYWNIGIKIDDPFILANDLVVRPRKERERGERIAARLYQLLYREGSIISWYDLNYRRYHLFENTKQILNLVMMIAVILAAITLSSTMGMKVIDMEIDIAMLKGIGASPKKLERQVFYQGFRYGVIGSVIGSMVSIILLAQINNIIHFIDLVINFVRTFFGFSTPISIFNPQYYVTVIPFRLYFWDLCWVIGFAIFLSVLAAWIPVRNLRKISALKIIRRH